MKEKALLLTILISSILVFSLVAFLYLIPQTGVLGKLDVSNLPKFNATLNALCTFLLITGYIFIRKKKFKEHKYCMITTFMLSSVFLISYVVYHAQAKPTHFGGEGLEKGIYFFILITHIILAAFILPMAILSMLRGLNKQYVLHRKIAKWTLPVWL